MFEQNTDYVGQGLKRLLNMYQGKPRMEAWVRSYLRQFQEIEDAAFVFLLARMLQTGLAKDDLLDKIGKIVGQGREGFDNDTYTLMIQARIQANRSDGKREQIIKIVSLLAPNVPVRVKNFQPATIEVEALGPMLVPPDVAEREFLRGAPVGGVKLFFINSPEPVENTFTWGDASTYPVEGDGMGWGDAVSDSVGGVWTSVYGGT